jgi:hypothetical protein
MPREEAENNHDQGDHQQDVNQSPGNPEKQTPAPTQDKNRSE